MKTPGAKPQILCIRKNLPWQLFNDRKTPLLVVLQNKHPTFNMLDLIHKVEVQSSFKRQVNNSNSSLNQNLNRTALGHTRISLLLILPYSTGDNGFYAFQ